MASNTLPSATTTTTTTTTITTITTTTTTTTTIPKIDLDPLGQHLCKHILQQLEHARSLTLRIYRNKAMFNRSTFQSASKDFDHELRENFELVVYPYQSLYELLGKKLYQEWNLYHRELYYFHELTNWIMERKPDQRNLRNVIAHNFNTGGYYRDPEGICIAEDEGETMVNRGFSASGYWDHLEKELPPLMEELEMAIKIFKDAIPHVAVKTLEKSEEQVRQEKERDLWKVDLTPLEIPEHWSQGDGEWVCGGDVENDGFSAPLELSGGWGGEERRGGVVWRFARVVLGFFVVGA